MNIRQKRLLSIAKRKSEQGLYSTASEAQRLAKVAGQGRLPEGEDIMEGVRDFQADQAEKAILNIKNMGDLQNFMNEYGWSFEEVMACLKKNLAESAPE
jgi:hypothetical protein